MKALVYEKSKKAGLCYAMTAEGVELPVIDITHPAFALDLSREALAAQTAQFVRETEQRAKIPALIQRLLLRVVLRKSVLARGIQAVSGGFLDGLSTYLLKLGPDNLGSYAAPVDRKIAASLPALAARLRLAEVARLLADGLAPALAAGPNKPCHLLNLGGGPAIDSLNALLLLQKERPGLLAARAICIHVLDIEEAGALFGNRALQALLAEGAGLHGLSVELRHVRYDWSWASDLRTLLAALTAEETVMACSSEGALFEYGSDEDITTNLAAFHGGSPGEAFVVGSVTRADEAAIAVNASSQIKVRMRGMQLFQPLAEQSGWSLDQKIEGPLSDQIRLRKA